MTAAAQGHLGNSGLAEELEFERNVGEDFGRCKEDFGGHGGGRRKASDIQIATTNGALLR